MRGVLLGLAAAVALGGAAPAQVVTRPDWAHKPASDEVVRYYPETAVDRSVSGRVMLACTIRVTGLLEDCVVESESPPGMGFGEAALKLAPRTFRMKPGTVDGKPVEGPVRIPLLFAAPTWSARYVITEAVWAEAPSFEDMAAAWPAGAGDLAVGTAVLRCQVASGTDGRLRNCTVAGQTPRESPFGEAALGLAGRFQLKLTPEEARKYASSDVAVSFRFYNPSRPAGQEKRVEKPDWIVRVNPDKVVALYPGAAIDAGVKEGVGVADCLVTPDGRLVDCHVAREAPADLGFGPAAVKVVGVMQMDPWTPEGRPVAGARVRVPVRFTLAPEAEPAAASQ